MRAEAAGAAAAAARSNGNENSGLRPVGAQPLLPPPPRCSLVDRLFVMYRGRRARGGGGGGGGE